MARSAVPFGLVLRGRATLLGVALLGFGCDRGCGSADRRALGQAMGAHDCPPDVAVCIGGEAFVSVGGLQGQGQPCHQLSLGTCERGCVAEAVPVGFGNAAPEAIRIQLCAPDRGRVLGRPLAPSGPCTAGETTCKEGVVQTCGMAAARCEHGCATDDVIRDEELDLEQAIGLLCQH